MSENKKDGIYIHSLNNLGRNDSYSSLMNRRQSVFAESYNPEEEEDFEPAYNPKTREEKDRISSGLRNHFLFKHVQEEDFERIIDAMFRKEVTKGEAVIKQGEEGEYFYCVESGVFENSVFEKGARKKAGVYENHGCFGELALMYNVPRPSTVVALTDGSLWALDRRTFRRTVLKGAYKRRILYQSFLEKVPIFSKLTDSEKMSLAEALVDKTFEDGERIVGERDPVGMYFVVSGSVRLKRKEAELKLLGRGDYFGEVSLVARRPMSDSAFASGKAHVAFLEVGAFERLLGPCVEVMKRCFEDYEEQLVEFSNFSQNANES